MTYTPGSAYDAGYTARINGGEKASNVHEGANSYWQEWAVGWNDANEKIISDSRIRNEGKLNESKRLFLLD